MKIKHLTFTVLIAAVLIILEFAPAAVALRTAPLSGEGTGVSTVYAFSKGRYLKIRKKMYKKINKFRRKKNQWEWKKGSKKKKRYNTNSKNKLGKLKRDKSLEKTAKVRARELVKRLEHTRPNGKSCFTAYPKSFRYLGENIAWGYETVDQVMEGWIEEDKKYGGQGHRRNMLYKNFKKVGVACYQDKYGYRHWVQCFGG